jgi:GAF domain-containing protein
MISTEGLADVFVKVADTLVDEFDLVEFLHDLAVHGAVISERPSVGIMVTDVQGTLHHLVASNHDVEALELLQLGSSEGPCLDCFRTGQAVAHPDLTDATDRWPTFAPRAIEVGFGSVHTFPMRLRSRVIGALNIFGTAPGSMDDETTRIVQALADVATIAILQERAIQRADLLAEQLQYALSSRTMIEQAKGAVARAFDVGIDEAFELLRHYARAHRTPLTDVAQEMLDDREAIARLR